MYSYWWTWQPPWLAWRQLWIEVISEIPSDISSILTKVAQVHCSCNDGSGDPDDICGDRNNPPTCSPPAGGAPVGGPVQVEAYREAKYSRIRFCNRFFNLSSLQEAITEGKKKSAAARNNLEIWNSRARVFFFMKQLTLAIS